MSQYGFCVAGLGVFKFEDTRGFLTDFLDADGGFSSTNMVVFPVDVCTEKLRRRFWRFAPGVLSSRAFLKCVATVAIGFPGCAESTGYV